MNITKEILKRATAQGFAEYLLYGSAIEGKTQRKDYDVKLNDAYSKYEEILKRHEEKDVTELVDSANDMASEVAEVYLSLGLQAGISVICDILKNIQ